VPFGLNARGRLIAFALIWTNLLVGAIPRMGKTFAARLMAAAAALDPWVRLFVFDGKGGRDLKPFEQVAYAYGAGIRLPVVERLLAVLLDLVEDMNARYERLQTLSDEDCPDGKLTPALARNRRLNMPLTVLFIDEVQRYLENRQYGAEICELLTELVKVGPAVGIMLILATQKPDAKVVPDSLRGQMGTRFALKTMTWQASETILGAGTYQQGLDSSKFLKSHKGVGILLGADESELAEEGAQIVRTHLLNGVGLAKICARGRKLREQAGTLAGAAAGEEPVKERHDPREVLEHVRQAFAPDESRISWETLAERLAEAHPDRYDGWDGEQVGNVLRGKPYLLDSVQVNRTVLDEETGKPRQQNRRGPSRDSVLTALGRLADALVDA
jgi:DNA segregation ATPase FtsK/SpoIIIE, S-DNA-T family